jgi:TetR/AcrR family transcriptional regulator
MHRGRKKIENPESARRILAAAERIFAARGLAGARTEEIARAAHVNKALLYYYFGSKVRLHRAVFENLFGHAQRMIQAEMPSSASPRQEILAFVDGYFKFRVAFPNYARLMQQMMMESPEEFRRLAREHFLPGHNHLAKVVREGVARGQFHRVNPDHLVINIIGMIVFYFATAPVQSVLLRRDALQPRTIAEHRRSVLDLLVHGLFRSSARLR